MSYLDFVIGKQVVETIIVEVPGNVDSDLVKSELEADGFTVTASGPGRDAKDAASVCYRAEKVTPPEGWSPGVKKS